MKQYATVIQAPIFQFPRPDPAVETRRQWPNYVAEFYTSFLPNALVRKQAPRTYRRSLFAARGVLETIVSRTTLNDLPTQQLLSTFSRPSRQAAQRRKILRL